MSRPELDGTYPSGEDVQAYILEFIQLHELEKKCDFNYNEAVVSVDFVDDRSTKRRRWIVVTAKGRKLDDFDYVVSCTGMYSLPNVPDYVTKCGYTETLPTP